MFKATGILHYDVFNTPGQRKGVQEYWSALQASTSIILFYQHMFKWQTGEHLNMPLGGYAHVTMTRGEVPTNKVAWRKYEGKRFEFFYSNELIITPTYVILPVESPDLERVRLELGLSRLPRRSTFHLTVGNRKNLQPKPREPLPFRVFPWETERSIGENWRKQKMPRA